jgi:1-deoxy-D-xylulose-5-phosphate reductoisomerase
VTGQAEGRRHGHGLEVTGQAEGRRHGHGLEVTGQADQLRGDPAAEAGLRTLTVLGSTGSIGVQTLEVAAAHPDRFHVGALAAGRNADLLIAQARAHHVDRVAVADEVAARQVREVLGTTVEVLVGETGMSEIAAVPADIVLNGVVGSRGLRPTIAALEAGNRVALANKESLIVGGERVLAAARQVPGPTEDRARGVGGGGLASDRLIPVDSEHSALAQCLRAGSRSDVERVILTASGGPFRGRTRQELEGVTVEDALAHPTWRMGSVITVNSATLANKGLEVIEAHLLFGIDYDRIEVVVHPQSVVHGLVEFCDGATVAKMSPPDMRLPIQLALGWPERLDWAPARLDWRQRLRLDFEPVDADTFPMVELAVAAGRRGGACPAVFNAANEEAVAAFLEGRLRFLGIPAIVEAVLDEHTQRCGAAAAPDLDDLLDAEAWARDRARARIDRARVVDVDTRATPASEATLRSPT